MSSVIITLGLMAVIAVIFSFICKEVKDLTLSSGLMAVALLFGTTALVLKLAGLFF